MSCGVRLAWSDRTCDGGEHCRHKGKCVSCGEPSTRECSFAGQLVCGAELCDGCKHYDSSRRLGQHRPATEENDRIEGEAFQRFLAKIKRGPTRCGGWKP
jgi:hypothetical protein